MSESTSGSAAEQLELGGGRPLPRPRGSARRKVVAGVGALSMLAVGAGAVWAWQAFMGQGAQPAEALPASTLAYVAVDFDPAAGQKLAALGFLRKFPSLEKHVGLTDSGDLRKGLFDEVKSDLGCGLEYADVQAWVGQRFAFALVDQGGPEPVMVLQVADPDQAKAGLERLADCSEGVLGYALDDDWAVLAESHKVAGRVLSDSAESPLSEDTEFQRWTGQAGEPGVVTLYAAPAAGPALVSAFENSPYGTMYLPSVTGFDPFSMLMMAGVFAIPASGDFGSGGATVTDSAAEVRPGKPARGPHQPPMPPPPTKAEIERMEKELEKLENMTPAEQEEFFQEELGEPSGGPGTAPMDAPVMEEEEWTEPEFPQPELPAEQRAALMNFSGLGGVVRFDDGALELELVSDRIEGTMGNLIAGSAGDDVLAALPADTAAVFSAGFRDGWGAAFVERFAESAMPFGGKPPADAAAKFERDTGLTVADLEALGGNSFALAAGAGFDPERLFYDPAGMKVAARVSGNADGVEAALAKVRARMPASERTQLQWRRVGDDVLVAANAGYLDELAASSGLNGAGSFPDAVPDAGDAASVFYLNFDAGDWLAQTVGKSDRPDAEPLAAVGYSLRDEGDRERTLLRVTTED
jgi:hypothetical protein